MFSQASNVLKITNFNFNTVIRTTDKITKMFSQASNVLKVINVIYSTVIKTTTRITKRFNQASNVLRVINFSLKQWKLIGVITDNVHVIKILVIIYQFFIQSNKIIVIMLLVQRIWKLL